MAIAKACSDSEQTKRDLSEQTGVTLTRLAIACIVLKHASDLAPQVLSGAIGLDKAYETAVTNKKNVDSEVSRMKRLRVSAADLHNQVTEGTLSLSEAIAALDAREYDAAEREKNRRETMLRLSEQAYYALYAWQNDKFCANARDLLQDKEFKSALIARLRIKKEDVPDAPKAAKLFSSILRELIKEP